MHPISPSKVITLGVNKSLCICELCKKDTPHHIVSQVFSISNNWHLSICAKCEVCNNSEMEVFKLDR
jgi:hypothetical protein